MLEACADMNPLASYRSPTGNENVSTPAFETRLTSTLFDWNLTTTAQENVANRSLPYQQGLGLGGGR